ncbi:3' terminal RNA ribose 2'-O-methyltransferase Hen1 [Geodermatophilus sp. URMC 63]
MLVTLSTTHVPATDLGFLLHKNPARAQQVDVSTGTAHVFYPEADEHRCTVALLLEVDPVGLVRTARAGGAEGAALAQYVNDRPYAASSLLAVALGKAFASARRGVSRERPDLVDVALPLEVRVPALSCRGGAEMASRFFAPLGWRVEATAVPLDTTYPEWGDSRYVDLRLTGELRLADALNHLYVALPVLDDAKHHWIGTDEVDKLLRAGSGWLATHPDRDLITRRYLKHRAALTGRALERLAEVDDAEPDTLDDATAPPVGAAGGPATGDEATGDGGTDRPVPLAVQRHAAVLAALRSAGASRVVDLGCGAGALLPALLADPAVTEVLGVDVSARALEVAARRLRLDRMPERQRARIRLLQSGLTYTDARLRGYDAAVLVEVVEHLDPDRLPALEHAVFGAAAPGTVVVTTPNAEYNVRFEGLAAGAFRHRDHRFEWTRAEFAAWTATVGERHGYAVRLLGVGDEDPDVGPPTQLAVFTRGAAEVVS